MNTSVPPLSPVEQLAILMDEVDTPELREICSEDKWITHQRQIYHRIRCGLDCDIPLLRLIENAIEDEMERWLKTKVERQKACGVEETAVSQ